jgi:hypothetical protein
MLMGKHVAMVDLKMVELVKLSKGLVGLENCYENL